MHRDTVYHGMGYTVKLGATRKLNPDPLHVSEATSSPCPGHHRELLVLAMEDVTEQRAPRKRWLRPRRLPKPPTKPRAEPRATDAAQRHSRYSEMLQEEAVERKLAG